MNKGNKVMKKETTYAELVHNLEDVLILIGEAASFLNDGNQLRAAYLAVANAKKEV